MLCARDDVLFIIAKFLTHNKKQLPPILIIQTFVASLTMSIIIGDLGVDIARGLSAPPLLAARPVGLSLITM